MSKSILVLALLMVVGCGVETAPPVSAEPPACSVGTALLVLDHAPATEYEYDMVNDCSVSDDPSMRHWCCPVVTAPAAQPIR